MSQLDTGDLMTVEDSSQLSFIRITPADSGHPASGLRLFGFDLPPPGSTEDNKDNITTNTKTKTSTAVPDSSRKFECHYCCRNFSTSQALGGHQNAHKRERQHAKRAQFHSAAMAAHHHQTAVDGGSYIYSLLNYHCLSSAPTFHQQQYQPPRTPTAASPAARFYGGIGSVSQPINGNPMPGLQWRVHPQDRPTAMTMLPAGRNVGGASCFSSSSSVVDLDGYESRGKSSVSLDLHL